MKFTAEQLNAINTPIGNNLISAAAGSGKTAVLTKRIVNTLKNGIDIDNLIVLTFTNASAFDMKQKIIKAVEEEKDLEEQLGKINTSNIKTFDSYALSLVQKYNYLLDVEQSINIGDKSIFEIKKVEILEDFFNEIYKNKEDEYHDFLTSYTTYGDKNILGEIISLYNKLNSNIKLELFVNNTNKYEKLIENINALLKDMSELINTASNIITNDAGYDFIKLKIECNLEHITIIDNFNEFKSMIKNIKIPKETKSTKIENIEGINNFLKKLNDLLSTLKTYDEYDDENTIRELIEKNSKNSIIVNKIIKYLDHNLNNFKKENNIYEFIDIKRLSIKLLEDNIGVRDEIINSTYEILIDEYQDTDDVQEYFISLISKNNVYMVGDIKQSIYGFRGANPELFTSKYNEYKNDSTNNLITLNKNFRSSNYIINFTNKLFADVMSKRIGGVNYDENQKLVYGNNSFDILDKNNDVSILKIECEENINDKVIAAGIAKDIRNKIDNNYKVNNNGTLENVKYSDICILARNKKNMIEYVEIFEKYNIPLKIKSSTKFKTSYDIMLVINILKIIINYNNKGDHKQILMSLLRSYVLNISDDNIHSIIKNYDGEKQLFENIKIESLNTILEGIYKISNVSSIKNIITLIVSEFEILRHCNKLYDGEYSLERIERLLLLADQYDNMGKNTYEFLLYFNKLLENDNEEDIEFEINEEEDNVVNMMTIHSSKGLEFPVVYLTNMEKNFKFKNKNNLFNINDKYGFDSKLIYKDTLYDPITILLDEKENKRNAISEELRLLYVAFTRAESSLIIMSNYEYLDGVNDLLNSKNYTDLLSNVEFTDKLNEIVIEIGDYDTSLLNAVKQENNSIEIYEEYKFAYEQNVKLTASKDVFELFSKNTIELVKDGDELHNFLETVDFSNPNYEVYDERESKIITNLLNLDIINNNINMYSEYEFYYNNVHGIIDLLIEREDEYVILDYKRTNIDDDSYVKQLKTYKKYITSITDKRVRCALYSLLNDEIKYFD